MIDPETFAHDILTTDEERRLARQWRDAQLYQEMLRLNPDLPEQTRESFERIIRCGKEARNRMIECNQRLVLFVAARFVGRGLEIDDLHQAGNIGLMSAVDKFDPDLDNRFSTYAVWWIREAIQRAIHNQGRTIRLPVHTNEAITALGRRAQEMTQELGREPTAEELTEATGARARIIHGYMTFGRPLLSLETPVGSDGDRTLGEVVEDKAATLPDESIMAAQRSEAIRAVLASLTPKEARVIELRFGLYDGKSRTLEEVGQELGITRQATHQIERRALGKLRKPERARKLRNHL